jgi:hypothetical protein
MLLSELLIFRRTDMEREQDRYVRLRHWIEKAGDLNHNPKHVHSNKIIVCVLTWAALHDRPILWACNRRNWPRHLRPELMPTQSCMSRRLRTFGVQQLLELAFAHLRAQLPSGLVKFVDAKPLPVGGCTKDEDALYGRAASCKANGYKLYALVDHASGAIDQWLLGPMNWSEQHAAAIMFARLTAPAVIVGDGEYDSSRLYDIAASRESGLLAPPPPDCKGKGHRYQSPHRLDGLALGRSNAGAELLNSRIGIEQSFAHLTSGSCGLGPLQSWVRRPHRVVLWVAAKLLVDLDRRLQLTKQKANAA